MNKTALRNFSIWARKYLIEQISTRAEFIGVHKDGRVDPIQSKTNNSFMVNGVTFDFKPEARDAFEKMVKDDNIGWNNAIEEIAYTWFNRLLAIRFMEVNGYLENGINGECIYVIGSTDPDRAEPDAVYNATKLKYVDKNIVYDFQDRGDNSGLFRYILRLQCMELSQWMPDVFEKVSDFTELLMPETLLLKNGIVDRLNHDHGLEAKDFDISAGSEGQVEIFGWMYQFYISEKKDEVKGSSEKVNKNTLPAATQLFTPDWIVRYMVQNTLGKIWVTSQTNSHLKESMKYYLDPDSSDKEVLKIHDEIKKAYRDKSIRDIKFIDPCCGSGHVLVYAFDLFYQMYLEEGYSPEMIPSIILENNLVGLDIDKRAIQLTSFALTMKARSYNKNLFHENYVFPNVTVVKESNGVSDKDIDIIARLMNLTGDEKEILAEVVFRYKDAEYYGSLIKNFDYNAQDYKNLYMKLSDKDSMGEFSNIFDSQTVKEWYALLCDLVKTASVMKDTYDCVVTNPPYQSPSGCGEEMKKFAALYYPESKADMYAMFIERCRQFANRLGLQGMITMQGWMFIGAFEKLRKKFKQSTEIISLLQLGPRAFEDISGEIVQTATWIMTSKRNYEIKGTYFDLTQYEGQDLKRDAYLQRKNEFHVSLNSIQSIPGIPFAYWAGEKIAALFEVEGLKALADPRKGIVTMNDDLFVRLWAEVDITSICFNSNNVTEFIDRKAVYAPIRGGGGYRKWYGNKFNVIRWENNGKKLKNYITEVSGDHYSRQIFNEDRFFDECISWNSIASKRVCFRYHEAGALFGSSGPSMFPSEHMAYILAFVNSTTAFSLIKLLKQSQNLGPTLVGRLPIIIENEEVIEALSNQCVELCKKDWDSYELSWEFMRHPMLGKGLIKDFFALWKEQTESEFIHLKENEEAINKLFTSMYGMTNLDNTVKDEDVSLRIIDAENGIKSLISYAVGCIMGRYSLKEDGLIYAGGEWDASRYAGNFKPCEYGVMLITDDQYFEEDLCTRVIDFIEVVYGKDTLNENLIFIAQVLKPGSKNSARKIIRDYLYDEKGFFDNHYQIYQHRPIYWMMSSGKNGGFRAIVYMHRYNQNTLSIVRSEFLHELRYKYEADRDLQHKKEMEAATTADRNDAKKKITNLDKKIVEVNQYDDLINHAAGNISAFMFDLDDGVKTNYGKFLNIDGVKTHNLLVPIKL
jgi:hypothetical protein